MISVKVEIDNSYKALINLVRLRGNLTTFEISKILKIPLNKVEMLVFRGVNESYLHKSKEDHTILVFPKYLV